MESADAELKGLAKAVHEVAIAFRSSNKMAAALRNLQQRAIKLGNLRKPTRLKMLAKTRWNAVTDVLESHSKAREQLIQTLVQNAGKGLVDIDIANKVAEPVLEKHLTYLQTVKKLSKKLQTHGLDIATGQSMLDGVIAAVENGTDGFENCKLNPTKISLAGCADSDKSFVSGVIKIIEKNEGSMTDDEKASCQCLLKPRDAMAMEEPGEVPEEMDLLERVAHERKRKANLLEAANSNYVDGRFVVSSASPVEGVWSFGDCVLTKRRASMSPLTFELIMYLNYNQELWDVNDVIEANKRRKDTNKGDRATRVAEAQALEEQWTALNVEIDGEAGDDGYDGQEGEL